MKKFIILFIINIFALPVLAVCSITDAMCTVSSNWESKSLQQRLIPDRLEDIKRTDAFQPAYVTPYHDALINTEQGASISPQTTNNYNSNCQFGVCLPGVESGGDVLE